MKFPFALVLMVALTGAGPRGAQATAIKAADMVAFNAAVPRLRPGDTLVLAAGVWRDARLVFRGEGTEQKPIILRAERPGATQLQGQSNLRLGGQYLVVMGLDFRNGYSPNGGVVEFRVDSKNLAFNCRVTECVIDGYNSPTPGDSEGDGIWIKYFGQHNRFDHNYVAGKKTQGTTMAVDLAAPESRENGHRIDHNYFGPRPRLGSNGGETLRIGVSTYSLSPSRTVVEENYFYHCNGEVEIISIKSGENIVRWNVFEECEGSVVMRHGNGNLIEGNYFLGNGKEQTGGVRVINAGHHIVGNYFADLTGDGFRGALVLMNGIPNSPLNRYMQVRDVVIENNIFVNCDNVELGAGKDSERSLAPANVTLKNNVFYGPKLPSPFHLHDDMSGLTFSNNTLVVQGSSPAIAGLNAAPLITQQSADGLLVPTAKDAPKTALHRPVTASEAGPRWFRPATAKGGPRSGKVWSVPVGTPDALRRICQAAQAGDVIELMQTGIYPVPQTIGVAVPLTVRARAGLTSRPVLTGTGTVGGQPFFTIENGGSLRLLGLAMDGAATGPAGLIQPSARLMLDHYGLWASNCAFYNLKTATGNVFRASTATFADTVQFTNCLFYDLAGSALNLATETQDKGTYNAEHIILRNCLFRNVSGSALDLYRGGNDESTLGPFLTVDHCTFDNVGTATNPALKLTGVQWSDIRNSLFYNSAKSGQAIAYKELGKAKNLLSNTNFYQSGQVLAQFPPHTSGVTYLPTDFMAPQQLDYRLKKPIAQLPTATDSWPLGFTGQ